MENNVQSIFGLKSTQIFNPQVLDVKFMYDQREVIRLKAKKSIAKCRLQKERLGKSRDLVERRYLAIELEVAGQSVRNMFYLYRVLNKETQHIEEMFYKNLYKNKTYKVNRAT